jgi:hypothetical protein
VDFIKDTGPGASRFREKFDENPSVAGQGFVHHEKRTLAINMEGRSGASPPEGPGRAALKV